jgi:hypothetical protein
MTTHTHEQEHPEQAPAMTSAPARDPVCGMSVAPAHVPGGSRVHDGRTSYSSLSSMSVIPSALRLRKVTS